jgi:hypothetical protein
MFQMHRIFCATPWEMEAERFRYYDVIGKFNELMAMPKGVLFVPVTLTAVRDKRPIQYAVDENIRDCRFYILLLADDWGPAERDFRGDYRLALECAADPSLAMQSAAVLHKRQPGGLPLADGLPEPGATFSTPAEFDECVTSLLAEWLELLVSGAATAP